MRQKQLEKVFDANLKGNSVVVNDRGFVSGVYTDPSYAYDNNVTTTITDTFFATKDLFKASAPTLVRLMSVIGIGSINVKINDDIIMSRVLVSEGIPLVRFPIVLNAGDVVSIETSQLVTVTFTYQEVLPSDGYESKVIKLVADRENNAGIPSDSLVNSITITNLSETESHSFSMQTDIDSFFTDLFVPPNTTLFLISNPIRISLLSFTTSVEDGFTVMVSYRNQR